MSVFILHQPQEELQLVARFQTRSELAAIRMKSFSARSAQVQPAIEEGLQLDLQHHVAHSEVAGATATFDITFNLEALGDKDPGKMLFHIDCCLEMNYTLHPGFVPTSAEIEAFQRANLVFHCWPYVREFVQSSTQRMGLAVPPIPMLRLQPLKADPKRAIPSAKRAARQARPAAKRPAPKL